MPSARTNSNPPLFYFDLDTFSYQDTCHFKRNNTNAPEFQVISSPPTILACHTSWSVWVLHPCALHILSEQPIKHFLRKISIYLADIFTRVSYFYLLFSIHAVSHFLVILKSLLFSALCLKMQSFVSNWKSFPIVAIEDMLFTKMLNGDRVS